MRRFVLLLLAVLASLSTSCGSKRHASSLPPRAVTLPEGVLLDQSGALATDDLTMSGAYADRYQLAVQAGLASSSS